MMSSPEEEVDITALMSFNAMDPLNALNDLAASAEQAQYSEDWSLSAQDTITTARAAPPKPARSQNPTKAQAHANFLFRLSKPLETPASVQALAGLAEIPKVRGDELSDLRFCELSGAAKAKLETAIREKLPDFDAFFVQYTTSASKDLSPDSAFPTLGLECTLPQHRAASRMSRFLPAQSEYPVWYFFYGTLAQREMLTQVLRVQDWDLGMLLPARIYGGRLGTWGGMYKALVDADEHSMVDGSAYQVLSVQQEDNLRAYETENYEVVRCRILIGEREVMGCTFRFVGDLD